MLTDENFLRFIYCSSAGVYKKSDLLPHFEVRQTITFCYCDEFILRKLLMFFIEFDEQTDEVDPKSRHKGKLETESLLDSRGVNWTSIRPVYIYGPLNYNPVEEWFFHRLKAGRPIPIPSSGIQITQLGHVKVIININQNFFVIMMIKTYIFAVNMNYRI